MTINQVKTLIEQKVAFFAAQDLNPVGVVEYLNGLWDAVTEADVKNYIRDFTTQFIADALDNQTTERRAAYQEQLKSDMDGWAKMMEGFDK